MPIVGITREGRAASDIRHTRGPVADLPIDLGGTLNERLARCLDTEGKIPRALEALGPVSDRDVLLVGTPGGLRERQLADLGARVLATPDADEPLAGQGNGSVDVVIGMWTSFRGADPSQVREAQRVSGRAAAFSSSTITVATTSPGSAGTFPNTARGVIERGRSSATAFTSGSSTASGRSSRSTTPPTSWARRLATAGHEVARSMTRPRLSYNVAVYHRDIGTEPDGPRRRMDA